MRHAFGEVVPAPAERVVEAPDGHVLEVAGRPLRCVDTPGHALHHLCVWDEESRGWFSGDTFGLAYPELDTPAGPFVFPTTSPVQLDPAALHASVDRLMATDPAVVYLTHLGPAGDLGRLADDNHRLIDSFVALAEAAEGAEDRHARLVREVGRAAENGGGVVCEKAADGRLGDPGSKPRNPLPTHPVHPRSPARCSAWR